MSSGAAFGLEVRDLTVAFGGATALEGVSLAAPMGAITGLIGPNGAGKTTLFNACSGLLRPRSGTVHLFGSDVTHADPARRARLGLGRTFQRVEVCSAMTVRDNVLVGCEARRAGARPWRQLGFGTGRGADAAVDDALERCGIAAIARQRVGALSTGQKRLVELARALAGDFRFLLLDEPSSGLDDRETDRFADILGQLVRDTEIGILLVEHDMALVMSVCEQLHVIDFGRHVFTGTPSETRNSEVVRAAYLGADDDQLASID